jgi:hypothetical protein
VYEKYTHERLLMMPAVGISLGHLALALGMSWSVLPAIVSDAMMLPTRTAQVWISYPNHGLWVLF